MKVIPVGQTASPDSSQGQQAQSARDRAISALMGSNAAVQDQNAVTAEETVRSAPTASADASTPLEATQATPEETPSTEAPKAPETPAEDPLSVKLAKLAQREKAARERQKMEEQRLQSEKQAWATERQQLEEKIKQYQNGYYSKDQLKTNALTALAEAGVSYDELTQQILTQQPVNPQVDAKMSKLEQTIAQLQAKLEAQEQNQSKSVQDSYQAAIKQITADVNREVFTNPEFEAVKAANAQGDVVKLIETTYQEDGVLLSVEEAAKMVEDHLIEEITRLTQISKLQKKPAPAATATVQATPVPQQQGNAKQPQMKTLTNATSASRPVSARERAILAMQGKLN